jgi:hypothetical protein
MISNKNPNVINEGVKQMQNMIDKLIEYSVKGDLYETAIKCLEALRDCCMKENKNDDYNQFAIRLQEQCYRENHKQFIKMIKEKNIDLI